MNLPAEFEKRMKLQLKENFGKFIESYAKSTVKGIRVNTLKISTCEFEKISPLKLQGNVPWEQSGFYVEGESLGRTVEHAAGAYYVQEPSAMCAVPELEIKPNERVLDLCAAPGGKTTQIAAYMGGNGVLVANEIDRGRNLILQSNLERAGVKNVLVTCADTADMAGIFANYFDKILVDAPCSGEGMFKKEVNAIPEWSVENVERCAQRQAKILDCADKMLACGGRLVYSTCTFSTEEDDGQIEHFLKLHPQYVRVLTKKLYPHEVRGEGHFCAVLEKRGGTRADLKLANPSREENLKLYREWEAQTLNIKLDKILSENNSLYLLFDGTPSVDGWAKQKIFCRGAGVFLGTYIDCKRFEPSHRLAMCLKAEEVKHIEVDEKSALSYLRGLTFECGTAEKGWRVVTHGGLPLGWCKVSGGVAKNHLPKGLRI